MNYVTDRATDHTTDCIITTEQLTKKDVYKRQGKSRLHLAYTLHWFHSNIDSEIWNMHKYHTANSIQLFSYCHNQEGHQVLHLMIGLLIPWHFQMDHTQGIHCHRLYYYTSVSYTHLVRRHCHTIAG